jgi:adenine-specific DNA-methyltransferase
MQKINIPQAESQSADLIQENIEQLKQIFPEVIKEGWVDFDALNDLLGNYTDIPEERFYLNWAGKANARREAQKRSTGTLRPCPKRVWTGTRRRIFTLKATIWKCSNCCKKATTVG